MKRLLLFLLLIPTLVFGGDLQLHDGDRIAFAGDSNMSQWRWVHYMTSYLILMNPTLKLHIWCAARGGTAVDSWRDDPTGYHGYDEYNKNDYAMQSKYVFAMLGVNGGETAAVFAPKMEDLVANYIVQDGATPIVLGPICTPGTGNSILSGKDDSVTAFCATHGWTNVRTYHDMAPTFTNPANVTRLTDSIVAGGHASTAGHIIEAYLIMKDLGWNMIVSNATINASNATVTSSDHCTISNVTGNAYSGIEFDRLDARLPWAIDGVGLDGTGRSEAIAILPELVGWLDYSVKVTDLLAGTYNVLCDGVQIGSVSNTTLSNGWNMADLTNGPVFDQVQEVLGRIRDLQGVKHDLSANVSPNHGMVRWRSNAGAYYGTQGKRGTELISMMQSAVTELNGFDDLIHAAAQPLVRHYSVRLSGASSPTPTVPLPTPTATCTCPS